MRGSLASFLGYALRCAEKLCLSDRWFKDSSGSAAVPMRGKGGVAAGEWWGLPAKLSFAAHRRAKNPKEPILTQPPLD